MNKALRLVGFGVLFMLLDYALLEHFASHSLNSLFWPTVISVLFGVIVYRVYPELARGTWAISVVILGIAFIIQVAALKLIAPSLGGQTLFISALFVIAFSMSLFTAAFAISTMNSPMLRTSIGLAHQSLRFLIFCIGLAILDVLVVRYFSRVVWPFFWPYPALIILAAGFAILLWLPELGNSVWMLRIVGLLLIIIGQSYLINIIQTIMTDPSLLAWIHLLGFTGAFLVMVLNYINQIRPLNHTEAPPLPAHLPAVAVIIPTYGEPYDILEKTVLSATRLDYPPELLHIVVSDDGHRPEIRQLAAIHNVDYLLGAKKDAKAGNLNGALTYLEQVFPQAELILTQDADEILRSTFLQRTVGYFSDPQIALVQTPKEVFAPKDDPFGTRDRIFYDVLQVGRNGSNAAFACGSGVLWRLSAIQSIGGFATWNVVEDLTTSYYLHSAGYRSEYHNEILTIGLAPDDIPGLLKQRGTWAVDTWRLFLFDNPLVKQGLSVAQRLQYLELGLFYLTAVFFLPLVIGTPLLSLATSDFVPLNPAALFPWITISVLYYIILSRGQGMLMLRMLEYWIGHWPTYTKALWIALRSRTNKPKYVVTRKTRENGFYGRLLWPQFLYLALGAIFSIRALLFMPQVGLGIRLANIAILSCFMFMVSRICRAAFYGIRLPFARQQPQEEKLPRRIRVL